MDELSERFEIEILLGGSWWMPHPCNRKFDTLDDAISYAKEESGKDDIFHTGKLRVVKIERTTVYPETHTKGKAEK